jgi:hypothetical protein
MRTAFYGLALALVSVLAVSAKAETYEDSIKPYNALLQRECPDKHLEWLSPADLNEVIDPFRESLAPDQRAKLDRVADTKTACAQNIAGTSCANIAYIRAATKLKLLPKLAGAVCNLPLVCRGQSDCLQRP